MSSKFERTASETVYEGKFFGVRKEVFRHEDGEDAEREIVVHTGAVGIVALDGDQLWFVRQPREAIGDPDCLELPAGKLEEGEEPMATAKRELAEEIGKAAEHWEPLTSYYSSVGVMDEEVHVVLATGLTDAEAEAEDTERIEIVRWPLDDLDGALAATKDAKTIIGLLLLRNRLR